MSRAGGDKATFAVPAAEISVPVMGSSVALVLDLLILAWLLYRQLTVRPLADGRFAAILAGLGLLALISYAQHHALATGVLAYLAASLVFSVVLGVVRAATVRIWRQGGQLVRQGTWLTALLWLVSIGGHIAAGLLQHGSAAAAAGASTLLFLGVTLGAQQLVVRGRAAAWRAA
jgi:hypothetical protein